MGATNKRLNVSPTREREWAMVEPDYNELENIKYHILQRAPRNESFWGGVAIIGFLVAGALAGVSYVARTFGYDPLLVTAIVGIGTLGGVAVSFAEVVLGRLAFIQSHLITLHEEFLHARSDTRDLQMELRQRSGYQ
jgi:hypothetical protein